MKTSAKMLTGESVLIEHDDHGLVEVAEGLAYRSLIRVGDRDLTILIDKDTAEAFPSAREDEINAAFNSFGVDVASIHW